MRRFLLYTLLLLGVFACSEENAGNTSMQIGSPGDDPDIVKILFIGNSLTYFNEGVDFHVQNFYDVGEQGINVKAEKVANSGYSLRNHLSGGATLNKINRENWDYIILQENGIVATTNPKEMMTSVNAFKNILDDTSSEVFFFMTWAYEGQPEMTQQLLDAYTKASALTGYKIIPVGLAWRDFQEEDNGMELLSGDGVHPSLQGTFFASSMLFKIISGQDIDSNSYRGANTVEQAQYIKEFVTQAVLEYY